MVRDRFEITVPPDAPPGLYDIQLGWYESATGQRLPVGEGDALRIAVLPVARATTNPIPLKSLGEQFAGVATLESFAWELDSGALELILRWVATDYLNEDYSVFVHLVDPMADDRLVGQGDAPPLSGRWPTSLWLPGVPLDDVYRIAVPADLAAGAYDLMIGLYNPRTGERLALPDGRDAIRLEGIQFDR
jgi:hypothetical protein